MSDIDYLKLELTLDEVKLLQGLLQEELSIQIFGAIDKEGPSNYEKRGNCMTIFSSFRNIDTYLSDLSKKMVEVAKDNPGADVTNVVLVHRSVCRVFRVLCVYTAKESLPAECASLYATYGEALQNKILVALNEAPVATAESSASVSDSNEKAESKLYVNIWGQGAEA